jgi:hypothetical protein
VLHDLWLRFLIAWYSWRARRLGVRAEPVMAVVVHLWQEDDSAKQERHLKLWFGHPTQEGAACRCGGRLVALTRTGDVLGVYHMAHVKEPS